MGAKYKTDPELEKLVQLVKTEMIEEGLRYSGNVIGRPRAIQSISILCAELRRDQE